MENGDLNIKRIRFWQSLFMTALKNIIPRDLLRFRKTENGDLLMRRAKRLSPVSMKM